MEKNKNTGKAELGQFRTINTCRNNQNFKRKSKKNNIYRTDAYKKNDSKQRNFSSLNIKLGICAAAAAICIAYGAVKNVGSNNAQQVINDGKEYEEITGSLKFVELPSIIEVFADKNGYSVPMTYSEAKVFDNENMVAFISEKDNIVSVSIDGVVSSIGEQNPYGKYVSVSSDNDIVTTYYGLEKIQVEQGQPLKKGDTLGSSGNDFTIYVSVSKAGRPQSINNYYTIKSGEADKK